MQSKGIWLLDASLHAVYMPGSYRIAPKLLPDLHQAWWHNYGKPLLDSMPGVQVWAVGGSVAKNNGGVAEQLITLGCVADNNNWIYQARARGKNLNKELNWPRLLEACALL